MSNNKYITLPVNAAAHTSVTMFLSQWIIAENLCSHNSAQCKYSKVKQHFQSHTQINGSLQSHWTAHYWRGECSHNCSNFPEGYPDYFKLSEEWAKSDLFHLSSFDQILGLIWNTRMQANRFQQSYLAVCEQNRAFWYLWKKAKVNTCLDCTHSAA